MNQKPSLWTELKRRNVFRVAAAYVVTAWLLLQAGDILLGNFEAPGWVFKSLAVLLSLGFPVVLVFAWAYEITPEGIKRERDVSSEASITPVTGRRLDQITIVMIVLALAVLAADRLWLARPAPVVATPAAATGAPAPAPVVDQSIAVLPLRNLMGDPEQDYFVEGMHEALIAELSRISALKVISRTSTMRYKGIDKAMPQIARELGVTGLIEGSVLREGDQVRITVQLIDGPTDRHLWAQTFDRELRGILALHSDVARAIAREIQVQLTPQEERRLAGARTVDPLAHESYLRGKFVFRTHDRTGERTEAAIPWFERAVMIDPDFALGHAYLAKAYVSKFFSFEPNPEWEQKAFVHLEMAQSLDPDLPEIYVVRGELAWTLANRFPHERSIQDYRKALELNPNLVDAHFALGSVYQHIGLLDKSLDELQTALKLDPNNIDVRYRIPRVYLYRQDYETTISEFERNPDFPAAWQWPKALALNYLGRRKEALALLAALKRELPHQEDVASAYAVVLAGAGKQEQAEKEIHVAVQSGEGKSHFHHAAYNIASAYALLGKSQLSLPWLKRTAGEGMPCYPLFHTDPNLDTLRSAPEFVSFMAGLKSDWERRRASL